MPLYDAEAAGLQEADPEQWSVSRSTDRGHPVTACAFGMGEAV